MRIAGEHRFSAPPERVWEALLDAGVLAQVLPGCESLERDGDDGYRGRLTLGVGPIQGSFDGRVRLGEIRPPSGYRLELTGRGPTGHVGADGAVALAADGAGTLLRYDIEVRVGGRIAAVGQRLLESAGRSLAGRTLGRLAAVVESESAEAPPPRA